MMVICSKGTLLQCSSSAVHLIPSTVCLITLTGIMNMFDHSDRMCLWHAPYVRSCPVNTSWLSSSEMARSCWVIALNICWYADVSPSLIKPSEQLISCRPCSVLCVLCVCVQRACMDVQTVPLLSLSVLTGAKQGEENYDILCDSL